MPYGLTYYLLEVKLSNFLSYPLILDFFTKIFLGLYVSLLFMGGKDTCIKWKKKTAFQSKCKENTSKVFNPYMEIDENAKCLKKLNMRNSGQMVLKQTPEFNILGFLTSSSDFSKCSKIKHD